MGAEPAKLTANEIEVIGALAKGVSSGDWDTEVTDAITRLARAAARDEIASLAGLALRRTQDRQFSRSPERNIAMDVANEEAAQFWGEVLAEYGDD